ncbi:MAG: hypothetical protein IJX30_05850 [Clostridia bacterium]|nr:hypothetical protein [Clostridia bacterium]
MTSGDTLRALALGRYDKWGYAPLACAPLGMTAEILSRRYASLQNDRWGRDTLHSLALGRYDKWRYAPRACAWSV